MKKEFSYIANLVNEKDSGGLRRRKFSSRVLNIIETSKQIVTQTHGHAKVALIHKQANGTFTKNIQFLLKSIHILLKIFIFDQG